MKSIDAIDDVVYRNTIKREANYQKKYDQLIESGVVTPYRDGQAIYGESFVNIMNLFDRLFYCWAKEDLAVEFTVPEFYHEDDLNQCNYLEQFHPQCVFTACSDKGTLDTEQMSYTGYVNNPAVCMHCYILHKDSVVEDYKLIRMTVKGRCKRKETAGYQYLERLHDFTMREIVFIGPENQVIHKREKYMKLVTDLISTLKLEGNIKVASDPFFKKEDQAKAEFQKKFKLKYEMNLINWDTGNEIAVGSFNYHHSHFAQAYNIRMPNGLPAHSCCIAFGLERLAYVVISQIGLEKTQIILKNYLQEHGYA